MQYNVVLYGKVIASYVVRDDAVRFMRSMRAGDVLSLVGKYDIHIVEVVA